MDVFNAASALVALAALFGLLNYHFLKLPSTIGIVVIALAASLGVLGLDAVMPQLLVADTLRQVVDNLDFRATVLDGMLAFLLFSGALHVDAKELRKQIAAISLTATVGVMVSTGIVGVSFWWLAGVPLATAMVFGALISPTDPIAVLGVLRNVRVPKALEMRIAGESLFNDGVGVVLVVILSEIAFATGQGTPTAIEAVILFLREAVGGGVLGCLFGWVAYQALRTVDEYTVEITMTLAFAMGTYAVAQMLHLSGPIAVVVVGLWVGNAGVQFGMTDNTRQHVLRFWHLIDEILNAVLFLLIGLEIAAVTLAWQPLRLGLMMIPVVLLARLIAVGLSLRIARPLNRPRRSVLAIMTWGGLRGAISVALALSLPDSADRSLILTVTYVIVVFTIIVQGLSIGAVARRVIDVEEPPGTVTPTPG